MTTIADAIERLKAETLERIRWGTDSFCAWDSFHDKCRLLKRTTYLRNGDRKKFCGKCGGVVIWTDELEEVLTDDDGQPVLEEDIDDTTNINYRHVWECNSCHTQTPRNAKAKA